MLHYFKFRQDLFDPTRARDIYIKRPKGRGWPEECPPMRAANSFGFDLLANFDVTFIRTGRTWSLKRDIVIESDFAYSATGSTEGQPLTQQYAWFWEKGQKIPHVISDNVYRQIQNQVKVSSFLFLQTDRDELLMMTDMPNLRRKFRTLTAVIDTDWYPASYPWHIMLELDPAEKRIAIKKGDPLARIIPLKRDNYLATQMTPPQFETFFDRGQQWLRTHGKFEHESAAQMPGVADITGRYRKLQRRAKFSVKS